MISRTILPFIQQDGVIPGADISKGKVDMHSTSQTGLGDIVQSLFLSPVEPLPGGGLTWARAEHDSPHGRIAVEWQLDGGRFELGLTVPPGCRAGVVMPSGEQVAAGPGEHRWSGATGPS